MIRPGSRVELVRTTDEYTRLAPGDRGTVTRISEQVGHSVYDIRWDDGSSLSMIPASGDIIRQVAD